MNKTIKEKIDERVEKILPELIELRHRLHRNPEIQLNEYDTAALIRSRLDAADIETAEPIIGTDTIAYIRGPGKRTILLRADIDGLPITETGTSRWASQRPGFAHSCGHDGHIVMLLGAALVLQELREALPGTVELVFQPAEERAGGGKILVEKGLLEREPVPDAVFALHGWPGRPLGSVCSVSGPMMAAADRFSIEIIGRGGHGARPNRCVDPIAVSAQVVQALQTIVSREVDPLEPVVVSLCMIHGGEADNVIPERVELKGTTRYFDPRYIETLPQRMEEVIEGVCSGMRASYRFDYEPGYIPLINDGTMVDFARSVTKKYVGSGSWIEDSPRTMGGEDFAYYLDKIPGAMLHLGLGEDWPELHTATFDFNDDAIPFGITLHCGLTFDFLG